MALYIAIAISFTTLTYVTAHAAVMKHGDGNEYFQFSNEGTYHFETYLVRGFFKSVGIVSYDNSEHVPFELSVLDGGGHYFSVYMPTGNNLNDLFGVYVVDGQGDMYTSYNSALTNNDNFTGLHHIDKQYFLYGNASTGNSLVIKVTQVTEPNLILLFFIAAFAAVVLHKSTRHKS